MNGHDERYSPWRDVPFDSEARCTHCRGTVDLIEGDGPVVVCGACITLFGGIAKEPDKVDGGYLDELQRLHGDVVRLHTLANGDHVWRWVGGANWPPAEGRGGKP